MSTEYSYSIQNTFCTHTTYRTHSIFSPSWALTSPHHNANVYRVRIQQTEHILLPRIYYILYIKSSSSPYTTSPQRGIRQNIYGRQRCRDIVGRVVDTRVVSMWCKDSRRAEYEMCSVCCMRTECVLYIVWVLCRHSRCVDVVQGLEKGWIWNVFCMLYEDRMCSVCCMSIV